MVPERRITRLKEYDYNQTGVYFLTICTLEKRCLLSRVVGTGVLDGLQLELTRFGKIAEKHLCAMREFYDHITIDDYVIMPNHIHLLLRIKDTTHRERESGPSGTPVPTVQNSVISRFVSTFKRFCNKEYGENIWQYRSYDHIIRDQTDYDVHRQYIAENPFKWKQDMFFTP